MTYLLLLSIIKIHLVNMNSTNVNPNSTLFWIVVSVFLAIGLLMVGMLFFIVESLVNPIQKTLMILKKKIKKFKKSVGAPKKKSLSPSLSW